MSALMLTIANSDPDREDPIGCRCEWQCGFARGCRQLIATGFLAIGPKAVSIGNAEEFGLELATIRGSFHEQF